MIALSNACRHANQTRILQGSHQSNAKITYFIGTTILMRTSVPTNNSRFDGSRIASDYEVYIMDGTLMDMAVPGNASYLFKKLMKLRNMVREEPEWTRQEAAPHFMGQKFYDIFRPPTAKVDRRDFMLNNLATPKAKFILWLALRGRLATKERLSKFISLPDILCVFCNSDVETVNHVTIRCTEVQRIWRAIQTWLGDSMLITDWQANIQQLCGKIKGNAPARRILKALITELIYALWLARNKKIFQDSAINFSHLLHTAVQVTLCRGTMQRKLADYCYSFKYYSILV
ncbi:hypothetical protein OROGR_029830 [Orobanche gracilis]